ncbi:(2Fe-2S)-binding protein [Streptomyces sp. NPDC059256]|uniref:(2Fe-2S)-binding protein n=1 Tax=Streptomyces sp. NPDC059256 TaxID=3346794 RepID=UPI00367B04A7
MDLGELSSIGGFFALRTFDASTSGAHGVPTSAPEGPGTPLARLYAGDDHLLAGRVDTVERALRTPERRIAVSIAQLGLAARLWSIAVGSAALFGELPVLDPDQLYWAPDRGTPDDLWLHTPSAPATVRTVPGTPALIQATVRVAHLEPLADAICRDTSVARGLLWGNAGSALAGAGRQLDTWARNAGRIDVAERAAVLVRELLREPPLVGTVRGPALRRATCCLYYRVPGGGLCGDCVFDHPPARAVR